MTGRFLDRFEQPGLLCTVIVAATLSGLLVGYEPIGGDPDRLYRPIKSELVRALRDGSLPFWSDRFGLGVPLVAESHVAAFYPPNWLLYGALDVAAAYRVDMWLHYAALAAATYAYARRLGVLPWGSALTAVAFSLCGFQTIHASHQWAYSALPFLPLALYFAEASLENLRRTTLALVALTWGAQLLVGHFQIAMWTGGLVLATGLWRSGSGGGPRHVVALVAALACGAALAAIQLVLSWDYAQLAGSTSRSLQERMFYVYPPAHWAELAVPRLFQDVAGGPEDPYWFSQGTTGYEAHLFVGTVPLILAFVGFTANANRALALWRVLLPASVALATMPVWFPLGYQLLLHLPIVGYFRAPARFTLITSLGLALFAGRGFDRVASHRQFVAGLRAAVLFGAAAMTWSVYWVRLPGHGGAFSRLDVFHILGWAVMVWVVSLLILVAWWRRWVPPSVPVLVTAAELAILFYQGPTVWGWSIDVPVASPVLRRLAQEKDVGTVGGDLHDLTVRAGLAPTYPYLGMAMLPPSNALDAARFERTATDPLTARLLRRLGMTHAVWPASPSGADANVLYAGADEALDQLIHRDPGELDHHTWYVVKYAATPVAHVARQARDAPDLQTALAYLSQDVSDDTAWFVPADRPPASSGPRARSARIVRWDGLAGDVDHDGDCDLVIRRTYAPGWTYRLNGGPEMPVTRVDGGLQNVRLAGAGPTHIVMRYRPPYLIPAAAVSTTALISALVALSRRKATHPSRTAPVLS